MYSQIVLTRHSTNLWVFFFKLTFITSRYTSVQYIMINAFVILQLTHVTSAIRPRFNCESVFVVPPALPGNNNSNYSQFRSNSIVNKLDIFSNLTIKLRSENPQIWLRPLSKKVRNRPPLPRLYTEVGKLIRQFFDDFFTILIAF